jgi:hypothetical protein
MSGGFLISLRSRADLNRSRSFCRALPNRSATGPFVTGRDKDNKILIDKSGGGRQAQEAKKGGGWQTQEANREAGTRTRRQKKGGKFKFIYGNHAYKMTPPHCHLHLPPAPSFLPPAPASRLLKLLFLKIRHDHKRNNESRSKALYGYAGSYRDGREIRAHR